MPERQLDLKVHIIAPSAYDDNDRLNQYSRILMLTPTFGILDGIVEKAAVDSNLKVSIAHYNERLERGDGYIGSVIKDESAQNSVTFITAKSFELPRAIDIAKQLKRAGKQVVLGGPGVTLADRKVYEYLIQEEIPFNVGEGENTIPQIIQDATDQKLKAVYWQPGYVDMRKAAMPKLADARELRRMMNPHVSFDSSRGCPFGCSYCSVRKICGANTLSSRCRPVELVVALVSEAHDRGQKTMITDDNLRTAFTYPESKRAFIDLNEEKKRQGRALYLFGQADVRPDIIREIPDLAAMGYRHLFLGMETKDKLVLAQAKKKQNDPEFYQAIVDTCHENDMAASTGRMTGFPPQTPESIQEETAEFVDLVDIINNFLVVPLPGTDDYFEAVRNGELTTWDLNQYDGTHSVRDWYENMTAEEAVAAYRQAMVESCPIKELFQHGLPSWDTRTQGRLYSRLLVELGNRLYGRPFHPMMDGIPQIPFPWNRVYRPRDGFVGFPQDPNDPTFKSPRSNRQEMDKYLSEVAWSPSEVAA